MLKQAHLFEHLEFTAGNAMTLEHSAIRCELAPCVFFPFRGSRFRASSIKNFASGYERKSISRRSSPRTSTSFRRSGNEGLRRLPSMYAMWLAFTPTSAASPRWVSPKRFSRLFDHRTESGFIFHISYSENRTQRRRIKCIMPTR
jgi:hypothetical protein